MLDSQEARRGSLMLFSEDSLSNNNSHEGMSVSTTMDGETLKKKLATMGVQNEVLMDSVHRPVWKESKQAERQLRRTGGKVVHDFSHFLEKQPPALNKVRTVSGLDRKVCQQAWRAIKRPLTSSAIDLRSGKKVYSSLTHDVFFTLSVHHNDLIEKSGLPRLDTLRVVTEGSTPKGTPKSSSMKGSSERIITLRKDDSFLLQVTNNSTGKNTPTKAMMKSRADSIHSGISGEGDHISIVQEDDRSWLKKSGGGSDLSLSCFSQDPRNTSKYYRRIAQVAKQNIPDLQVSELLDIDFTNQRINLGEKDMLERGLSLQKSGDMESAAIYYTRAGAHSKDQEISRMLLGNLNYNLKRLLSALKYYDQAIHIIESKPIGVRPRQHAFLAYYNRAIIYFRLGDDDDGIRDITTALEYNNEHLQAREILSLAKRRLGLYGQAIDEAIKHKNLKVDLHVKEIEKQRKAFEASQKLRMVKGNTTSNNNNDHDYNNNNNYDDDDIVHPIGEIQHSSHLLQSAISRRGESMLSKGSNNNGIKTMQIEVPESSCRSSLRDRVAAHRGNNNAFGAKDNDNNDDEERGNSTELADGYLKLFKMQHNIKLELFDEIFNKPNDIQSSLLIEPLKRKSSDIKIIANYLEFFPFLYPLGEGLLEELSQCVEYRAICNPQLVSQNNRLFGQNQDPYAVCLLMKGHIQTRLDYSTHQSMTNLFLDDYYENEVFGHIDYLFNIMSRPLVKVIEETLLLHPKHRKNTSSLFNTASISNIGSSLLPSSHGDGNDSLPSDSSDDDTDVLLSKVDDNNEAHQALLQELHSLLAIAEGKQGNNTQNAISPTSRLQRNGTGLSSAPPELPTTISRAIRPGMFATYCLASPCELLMFSKRDYYCHLYAPALEEFRSRLEAIKACGIFSRWRPEEMIRLARMGRILHVKRGTIIIEQGEKPKHLFIIMKGMCKVNKKPNRTEMLLQKLEIAREKAHQHDLKYLFHHKPLHLGIESSTPIQRKAEENVDWDSKDNSEDELLIAADNTMTAALSSSSKPSSPNKGRNQKPSTPMTQKIHKGQIAGGLSRSQSGSAPNTPVSKKHLAKQGEHHLNSPIQSKPASATMTTSNTNTSKLVVNAASTLPRVDHHHSSATSTTTTAAGPSSTANTKPPLNKSLTRSAPPSSQNNHFAFPNTTPSTKKKSQNKLSHEQKSSHSLHDVKHFPTVIDLPPASPTSAEKERRELQIEIEKLEDLISQARLQDAFENHRQNGGGSASISRIHSTDNLHDRVVQGNRPFTRASVNMDQPGDKEARELAVTLGNIDAEIATLQWPMIFGEACILDPEHGFSRGSVVADTSLELFVLHKTQIQTFQIDDAFLDRVKGKGVVFPSDPDIVVDLYHKQLWGGYCKDVMKDISTNKWPKSLKSHEPFSV